MILQIPIAITTIATKTMATLTKHEPVLTYERPFEPADEREVQVYIPTTERGAHSRYAKVRPCKGTSCEEILAAQGVDCAVKGRLISERRFIFAQGCHGRSF